MERIPSDPEEVGFIWSLGSLSPVSKMSWYFTVTSNEYGSADYGPYDSYREAVLAIACVKVAAKHLDDSVERNYEAPEERQLTN